MVENKNTLRLCIANGEIGFFEGWMMKNYINENRSELYGYVRFRKRYHTFLSEDIRFFDEDIINELRRETTDILAEKEEMLEDWNIKGEKNEQPEGNPSV